MNAVYRREMRTFFRTPFGYLYLAVFTLIFGIYIAALNLGGDFYPDLEITLSNMVMLTMLFIPILTMRTFAEERKQKTDQLLYALPLKLPHVVMAKFLASFTLFCIPLGFALLLPPLFSVFGHVAFLPAYHAIFGFALLGAALIAIGNFISSFTENQVVAAVVTFVLFLLMYLMNAFADKFPASPVASFVAFVALTVLILAVVYYMTRALYLCFFVGIAAEITLTLVFVFRSAAFTGAFAKLIGWLSVFDRFYSYANGILDLKAIVYYLSVTFLFLFFTVQGMEKRRWA